MEAVMPTFTRGATLTSSRQGKGRILEAGPQYEYQLSMPRKSLNRSPHRNMEPTLTETLYIYCYVISCI